MITTVQHLRCVCLLLTACAQPALCSTLHRNYSRDRIHADPRVSIAQSVQVAQNLQNGQVVQDQGGDLFMQEEPSKQTAPKTRPKPTVDLSNVGVQVDPQGYIVPLIQNGAGPVQQQYSQMQVYGEGFPPPLPYGYGNPYTAGSRLWTNPAVPLRTGIFPPYGAPYLVPWGSKPYGPYGFAPNGFPPYGFGPYAPYGNNFNLNLLGANLRLNFGGHPGWGPGGFNGLGAFYPWSGGINPFGSPFGFGGIYSSTGTYGYGSISGSSISSSGWGAGNSISAFGGWEYPGQYPLSGIVPFGNPVGPFSWTAPWRQVQSTSIFKPLFSTP